MWSFIENSQALAALVVTPKAPAIAPAIKTKDNIDRLFKLQHSNLYYNKLHIERITFVSNTKTISNLSDH